MKKSYTADRAELRGHIIEKMKTLVLPKKIERLPRPSIEEIESILRSEYAPSVHIATDGSVIQYLPQTTTIEKVADEILDLLEAQHV